MTDPIKASDTPAIESGAADAPTEIDEAEQRALSARARASRRVIWAYWPRWVWRR